MPKRTTPHYSICFDAYDKEHLTYYLFRETSGVSELILSKSLKDVLEFKQQVEWLARCFDASVLADEDDPLVTLRKQ